LLFTLGLALFAGVIFGLAPALQTAKLDLRAMLNEATRGSTGGVRHQRVRNVLVVTEVALAILLLIGAGLLLRSFERLQNVQPGFEPENLLVADVPLSPQAYPQSPERMAFFDRLLERARALPGVRSAGGAVALPVSGTAGVLHFNIEGRAPKSPRDFIVIGYRPVSPGYLQTLGVPLAQGRLLTDADTERGPFVVVVNQAMVRRYFPDGSAMGKHVQIGATPTNQIPFMEIVGIVGDVKQSLATDPQAEMYLPIRQADAMLPIFSLSIVLRTQGDPRTEISSLRSAIHDLDPNQPVEKIRTMQENISSSVTEPRFRTVLLGIFAMSALLLSVIGLYGLMAYSVSQRVHEIGIRMTLGAQKRDVMWMIVGQGMLLTLLGVGIGSAAAVLLTKLLARFLYGVSATDPVTFAAVSLVLLVVALLACYLPARRATKVDPMIALRYE
jgi:putative ABC transport system permease protein